MVWLLVSQLAVWTHEDCATHLLFCHVTLDLYVPWDYQRTVNMYVYAFTSYRICFGSPIACCNPKRVYVAPRPPVYYFDLTVDISTYPYCYLPVLLCEIWP